MADLRAVAQQALEALESVLCDPEGKCCIDGSDADRAVVDKELAALRAALAQAEPVQEPFALTCPTPKACREHCCHGACLPAPQQAEPTRSQKLADARFSRRPGLWALQARWALALIAAPQRADGTWNRDREACRQLAAEALGRCEDE